MRRLTALACSLFPLFAFAQDVTTGLPGATGSASTLLGNIFQGVAVLVLGLVGWGIKEATSLVAAKAAQSRAWGLANVVWTQAQAFVQDAISKLQPEIVADLADGNLSKDELKALETHALALLTSSLAGKTQALIDGLHLGDSAVGSYLSGMVGGALRAALAKIGVAIPDTGTPSAAPTPKNP